MKTILRWHKGFFGSKYEIFRDDKFIGSIKPSTWKQISEIEINGIRYTFNTIGFFKPVCEIRTADNNVIGQIKFNTWGTNANIEIFGKKYFMKYEGFIGRKFSLTNREGSQIHYTAKTNSGKIVSDIDDDLAVFAGIHVYNYYLQITMFIVIVSLCTTSISLLIR